MFVLRFAAGIACAMIIWSVWWAIFDSEGRARGASRSVGRYLTPSSRMRLVDRGTIKTSKTAATNGMTDTICGALGRSSE
jgi:hypothetical protein